MGSETILSLLMALALMGIGWLAKTLAKIKRKTDDLWLWHNKEDIDGVKIWYVRQSLEEAIEKLAEAIEGQTKLLDRVIRRMEALDRDVRKQPVGDK